jgi:spoIIIJ-associated protein
MEWVETTGRTIEAALDAALDELGVDESDVEYEVVQEPKAGLFGRIGSTDARVRARVKPISREKPGERQRRARRGSGSRGRANDAPANDAGGADGGAGTRPSGGSRSRGRRRGGGGAGSAGNGGARSGAGSAGGSAETSSPKDNNGSGRRTERTSRSGRPTNGGDVRAETEERAVETIEQDVPIEEQAQAAQSFTEGLIDAFDLGAAVDTVVEDDVIRVEVTGEALGLLVGPKGATLGAIEELVRTVVQRQTDGHGARINVDVGGYRAKRREALEEFTRSLAERVLETGRAQRLEPMSAVDRKIVHDAAAEIDGVATESEGEDPRRRVVLRPA